MAMISIIFMNNELRRQRYTVAFQYCHSSSVHHPDEYAVIYLQRHVFACTYVAVGGPRQGIGLNEQRNIKKNDAVSYKALSMTSSVYKDEVGPIRALHYAR